MYPRVITRRRGDKVYRSLHIVESHRVDGKVKQRSLVNFGPLERLIDKDVDNLINGLCRIFGRALPGEQSTTPVTFESARSFGDVFVLLQLWKSLKLTQHLQELAAEHRMEFDAAQLVQLLVFNRIIDPRSKLALLEWLETVHVPGVAADQVEYHHLLRTMDWLIEHKEEVERRVANEVLDLFDQQLDLVFWDVTSSYFETETSDELRTHGYSRDHRSDRPQIVLGVVMTRDGFPVHHEVFAGNTSDVSTLLVVAEKMRERYGVDKLVLVGDRGMLSEDNRRELDAAGFGYILAHRLRNRKDIETLCDKHASRFERWDALTRKALETLDDDEDDKGAAPIREHLEVRLERGEDEAPGHVRKRRLVVSYDQGVAATTRRGRLERLDAARRELDAIDERLLSQDRGEPVRGRNLTEDGALLKAAGILRRHRVRSLVEIGIDDEHGIFRYSDKQDAQSWEDTIDGVLVMETSLTISEADAREVERQYRNLQDIERCFRTMKTSLKLRPVYHWSERRIRAHVFICVLALLLMRILRAKLGPVMEVDGEGRSKKVGHSPEAALRTMARLQRVTANAAGREIVGLTSTNKEQRRVLRQLDLPLPSVDHLETAV